MNFLVKVFTCLDSMTNKDWAGMAKGGGIPKPPPLELKILENPPLEKFWNTPPPLKSGAKRRLRTGFNHN